MNLLRTRPKEVSPALTTAMARMRNEMEHVFDRWLDLPMNLAWPTNGDSWMPTIDVIDGDNEITIKAEVPGMAAKDVNVSINGNVLTLTGEKDESKEEKGRNFYVSERHFGSFQRSIELPDGIDADKISAEQSDGVLCITVRKFKSGKSKPIPVKPTTKA